MPHVSTSDAVVRIDRSGRYGKQLVNHLGRRYGGHWSDDDCRGTIDLQEGKADVVAGETTLSLSIVADDETIGRLEAVVGDHLRRFVGTDLDIRWVARGETTPL